MKSSNLHFNQTSGWFECTLTSENTPLDIWGSQTLLDLRILRCVLKFVHQGPDPRGYDFLVVWGRTQTWGCFKDSRIIPLCATIEKFCSEKFPSYPLFLPSSPPHLFLFSSSFMLELGKESTCNMNPEGLTGSGGDATHRPQKISIAFASFLQSSALWCKSDFKCTTHSCAKSLKKLRNFEEENRNTA